MNVATALNRKYVRYAIVMLISLCENNPEHIDAYLLNSGLLEEDLAVIREALKDYDINILSLKVDEGIFDDKLPRNSSWTLEIYYRLLLPEILPEEVERIFYLDVDIIVNKSLREFYEVDFEQDEIIACEDKSGKNKWEDMQEKQREMLAGMRQQGGRYFNSGVMLLNIKKLRENYDFNVYLKAMEDWNYEMTAPDQDILNYVHWQKVGYVDPFEYNLFARIAHNEKLSCEIVREKAYIVHFAGDKPWQSVNVHYDVEKLWWDYAKKSPFYTEFLEEFLLESLSDTTVENYIISLETQGMDLSQKLKKSVEMNQKLVNLMQRKMT